MPVLSKTKANIKQAGFKTIYLKYTSPAGVADPAYHILPFIKNGKASYKYFLDKDSLGQDYPISGDLNISFDCMATNKTNLLKVLDSLALGQIDFMLKEVNDPTGAANAWSSSTLNPATIGLKWLFVCDGTVDKTRFVTFTLKRKMLLSDLVNLIGVAPVVGTPAADVLLPFDSLARGDMIPAGFKSVTCSAAGGGGNTDNFGFIRTSKLSIELMVDDTEEFGISQAYGAHVKLDFEAMQRAAADITQLNVVAARANDYLVTLMDGTVLTLTSAIGFHAEVLNDKDSNGIVYSKVGGEGIIPISSVDGLFV
jgi:hypothetical protein